jgi:toxin ParE1/3/4
MPRYRISPAAREDLRQLRDFISRDDPAAADRFLDQIADRFLMLTRQPLIGSPRDDVIRGLRDFTIGNYVIFYRPPQSPQAFVEIVRILHCARDVHRLLGNHGTDD